MNAKHYSMIIQSDPRDAIYIVTVPELPGCRTHGATYEEAIKNALEAIELWIMDAEDAGEPIPAPAIAV
ncbi:MAG: type II toxin-antitoxin system HicB family antitoxin [Chloroflexi bacterium]|nr:MAG: type II toxin-antitoxin system HicB family antitoxin [Chloroflexota bacterium]